MSGSDTDTDTKSVENADDADALPAGFTESELDALADGSSEEAVAARVGSDLAERCRVIDTGATYADDAVVEAADPDGYVVTNDRPLRDRLLERGVRVIGLRGKDKLDIQEP